MSLSKKKRQELYEKTNGKCGYCGLQLEKGWHADHIEPVIRKMKSVPRKNGVGYELVTTNEYERPENDHIDNMIASCPPCNRYKSSMSLEDFRSEILDQANRARRYSVNFRMAEKYGLANQINLKEIRFYFESLGVLETIGVDR